MFMNNPHFLHKLVTQESFCQIIFIVKQSGPVIKVTIQC